jgi:hypothetical protein
MTPANVLEFDRAADITILSGPRDEPETRGARDQKSERRRAPIKAGRLLKMLRTNPDQTTNLSHPENAIYLRPLPCAADEEDAQDWAAETFSVEKGRQYPDTEAGFEQCLVDHRRMFCELEYWLLLVGEFLPEDEFPAALKPLRRKDH